MMFFRDERPQHLDVSSGVRLCSTNGEVSSDSTRGAIS